MTEREIAEIGEAGPPPPLVPSPALRVEDEDEAGNAGRQDAAGPQDETANCRGTGPRRIIGDGVGAAGRGRRREQTFSINHETVRECTRLASRTNGWTDGRMAAGRGGGRGRGPELKLSADR